MQTILTRLVFVLLLVIGANATGTAQTVTRNIDHIRVTATQAVFLGKTQPVRTLAPKPATSAAKKDALRRTKKVPDNFKARRYGGKSVRPDLEHQGADPLRQTRFAVSPTKSAIEPLVNVQGLGGFGSPHDPSGDVSDEYYVQAINVTFVGVFDLEGNLVQEFAMNTLWADLGESSAGDPIVLYDEVAEKWFITEFTDPANLLVAVSETSDPLGSYFAYSFATPEFPDYPKYAIAPDALVVTTNEGGSGALHQYFIDIAALRAGAATASIVRVEVMGNTNTEAGFYVTTPVDWNGLGLPFDSRPMTMAINDSSWPGGPDQDQIEIYHFDVDFETPANTTVEQTSIVTTPFDGYPCSAPGFGFACAPQLGGGGLDAIPEVVMNVPHLRNFGTHESLVFNFVTDVTDGDNLAGIRWVELRRTADTDWVLYQEGTLALEDGLDRYMGGIAMDSRGNIGLAYNVSSEDTYVGVRFTGRYAFDPLGVMTIPEGVVVDGASPINSGGRFGDYSQMSVSPQGDDTFWFTTEYAANDDSGTRIVAFQLSQDTFDLAARAIINPRTSNTLGGSEQVTGEFLNSGLTPLADFEVGLLGPDGSVVETIGIPDTLFPDSTRLIQFTVPVDMSAVGEYPIGIFVRHPADENPFNDTLRLTVRKLLDFDASLLGELVASSCDTMATVTLTLKNLGGEVISTALLAVSVNGVVQDTITYTGSLAYNQSDAFSFGIAENLQMGDNSIVFTLIGINGNMDIVPEGVVVTLAYELLAPGEFVTLVFNTDEYPEESEWTITDSNTNAVIASGGFDRPSTLFAERICLPADACYVITVTDSYGDGICCEYGKGYFSVLDSVGNVLLYDEGRFGDQTVGEFCPRGGCFLVAELLAENASGGAIADGTILVEAANGQAPYTYSIDGGETFQDSPLFEGLLPGVYEITVRTADGLCTQAESATVGFTTGVYVVNGQAAEVRIAPNPTDGVFKITIAGLAVSDLSLDVEIFNVSGQLVQHRNIGRYGEQFEGTFSLYDYPSGYYFLRIRHPEVHILERVVKVGF